jgi:hypothetical protein
MSQDLDEPVAWRLFTYNWVPLGLMALALVLAMALTSFFHKNHEHSPADWDGCRVCRLRLSQSALGD